MLRIAKLLMAGAALALLVLSAGAASASAQLAKGCPNCNVRSGGCGTCIDHTWRGYESCHMSGCYCVLWGYCEVVPVDIVADGSFESRTIAPGHDLPSITAVTPLPFRATAAKAPAPGFMFATQELSVSLSPQITRGCHGAVVARQYTPAVAARVRRATTVIQL